MKSFSIITLLLINTLLAKGQTQINIKDYETRWMQEDLAMYVKPQFAEVVRIFSFKNEKNETVKGICIWMVTSGAKRLNLMVLHTAGM